MAMRFAMICAAVTRDKMAARLYDVAANYRSAASTLTGSWQGTATMALKKALISGAIVLGCCVVGAAQATADTNRGGGDPNPFSGLSCSCRDITSPGSPALMQGELERGIQAAMSASPPQPAGQ